MHVRKIYLHAAEEIRLKFFFLILNVKKMPRDQIMKVLKETIDLNFDKEVQVKYEINKLIARKDEELEYIILRNRHLGRPDRVGEKKIIG